MNREGEGALANCLQEAVSSVGIDDRGIGNVMPYLRAGEPN